MLRVDPNAMNNATADMMQAVTAIDERLDLLETAVQRQIDAGWIGDATEAYRHSKKKWDGNIKEMRDYLVANAQAVTDANDHFMATDRSNANRLTIG